MKFPCVESDVCTDQPCWSQESLHLVLFTKSYLAFEKLLIVCDLNFATYRVENKYFYVHSEQVAVMGGGVYKFPTE